MVKEGFSYANALKSIPSVSGGEKSAAKVSAVEPASNSFQVLAEKSGKSESKSVRAGREKSGKSAENETDERNKQWIKLDISYGSHPIKTDFTANMLQWPKKMPSATSMQAIKDIIARRIVPVSCIYTVKNCYRLINLYRRGYEFGLGDPSDVLVLKEYLKMACPDTRRSCRQQNRSREIFGLAFTGDMSSPSMSPSNTIRTTKHALTNLTVDYVSSLPEYHALASRAGMRCIFIAAKTVGIAEDTNNSIGNDNNIDSDTEDTTCNQNNDVEVTTAPMRVYKMAEVWMQDCNVCIALDIPVGTRYLNNSNVYIFESAEIAGLYTYPFVRVNDIVQMNQLTIVSNYDKNFIYVKEGEIKQTVHAQNGSKITAIDKNQSFGIYAYKTLIEAWGHYGAAGHFEKLLTLKKK
jgi:hypothetical protein